jgi:hypothetical protein
MRGVEEGKGWDCGGEETVPLRITSLRALAAGAGISNHMTVLHHLVASLPSRHH